MIIKIIEREHFLIIFKCETLKYDIVNYATTKNENTIRYETTNTIQRPLKRKDDQDKHEIIFSTNDN